MPRVLALGAFLKNTLCLVEGSAAALSRDLGNLETREALVAFEQAAEDLLGEARGPLAAVAHDRHPDFPSTRHAEALARRLAVPAVPVQHHHAHVAAVMAEHGHDGPVLGLALDGFGLGDDGGSWGGELLHVGPAGFRRLGHLAPLSQPGGDRAAREPWRMAAAALHALGRTDEIPARLAAFAGAGVIAQMLAKGINAPVTTSCGRLFDAACGLLGVKPVAHFEGEAPMALEALVDHVTVAQDGWRREGGVLDLKPLLARLDGMAAADGAALFHGTLVAALADWVAQAAAETGVRDVVFSGGCFLNKVLRSRLREDLAARGFAVLEPVRLSPGDMAISLGQAWAVALALQSGGTRQ